MESRHSRFMGTLGKQQSTRLKPLPAVHGVFTPERHLLTYRTIARRTRRTRLLLDCERFRVPVTTLHIRQRLPLGSQLRDSGLRRQLVAHRQLRLQSRLHVRTQVRAEQQVASSRAFGFPLPRGFLGRLRRLLGSLLRFLGSVFRLCSGKTIQEVSASRTRSLLRLRRRLRSLLRLRNLLRLRRRLRSLRLRRRLRSLQLAAVGQVRESRIQVVERRSCTESIVRRQQVHDAGVVHRNGRHRLLRECCLRIAIRFDKRELNHFNFFLWWRHQG